DNMRAIELKHPLNAGIDGAINNFTTLNSAYQHTARTTVSFGTDDLGASQTEPRAQIVGQREKGIAGSDRVSPAIDIDDKMITHGVSHECPPRCKRCAQIDSPSISYYTRPRENYLHLVDRAAEKPR